MPLYSLFTNRFILFIIHSLIKTAVKKCQNVFERTEWALFVFHSAIVASLHTPGNIPASIPVGWRVQGQKGLEVINQKPEKSV